MHDLMTVPEVAHKYRQSEATIRKWAKEGRFPSLRPGGKILISESEYVKFLAATRLEVQSDKDVMAMLRGLARRTA